MTKNQYKQAIPKNERPAVSVIMSVYNTERFLPLAIESILHQSFNNFEFIIVNDGSTDRSGAILDTYARRDKRLRIIHQHNTGISKALNKAIEFSRGALLARQDPDDISLPNRLLKQINYFKKRPSVDVLGSCNFVIGENGRIIACYYRPLSFEAIKADISSYNPLCHGSVMMRKEAVMDVGLYNSDFDKAEDLELWMRMISARKRLENMPDFLYCWRTHSKSVAGSSRNYQKEVVKKILDKYQVKQGNKKPIVTSCFCGRSPVRALYYMFQYILLPYYKTPR